MLIVMRVNKQNRMRNMYIYENVKFIVIFCVQKVIVLCTIE